MRRIRLLVIILLVFAALFTACTTREKNTDVAPDAPADAVPDLLGSYVVNGYDPLGVEYSGHLTITSGDEENEYNFQWIVVGSIQEGFGVLEGNQLHVEWHNVEGIKENSRGEATYTVTEKGELYGTRTVVGHSETGTETAYPND